KSINHYFLFLAFILLDSICAYLKIVYIHKIIINGILIVRIIGKLNVSSINIVPNKIEDIKNTVPI
ncbi:MAG: hypothetical protein ACTHWU_09005, partial [Senegalia sp. (in: firmicutes)]|uniref:hypothetical protein n=1 Tax=Senegalia sp. (in: firmicutes) TaxID=1924098 RepID=UPI003F9BD5A0